jgi:hypothetical protein
MSRTSFSNCAKPAGQYCRLHNPAPAAGFQQFGMTRELASDVPHRLAEHVQQNRELAEELLTEEERVALSHYPYDPCGGSVSRILRSPNEPVTYDPTRPSWREPRRSVESFASRAELVSYVETLDAALSKRQENARIVYRGMSSASLKAEIEKEHGDTLQLDDVDGWHEALTKFYRKGRIFKYDNYLSTSVSAAYSANWVQNRDKSEVPHNGVVFEMKTNAGTDITGLGETNNYAHEREVLLPRETYFKVVSVDVMPQEYKTKTGIETQYEIGANIPKAETHDELAAVVQMVEVDKEGKEISHQESHFPGRSAEAAIPTLPKPTARTFFAEWLRGRK